jgi:Flp pilus assembly protein CpaB
MRRPLFLIGIGMSLVAFLLVVVLGSSLAGRATAATAQVTVVVAARDIAPRHVIGAADLATTRLPETAMPPGAVLNASDATGRVAQVQVLSGQPVTSNLIAKPDAGAPGYLPIPKGWVAFTLPASELQAVGGYIAAGDVIDVQATVGETAFAPSAANPRQLTRIVFQGVRIIEVGPAAAKVGQAQTVATSLTALLTPCDAPYMTWLLTAGTLRYTLRSSNDYAPAPTGPDPSCPAGSAPVPIGPAEVDRKFGFTKA